MAGHAGDSRLLAWWRDDPADPGRPAPTRPGVRRLVAAIAPGSPVADLGGTMSLNVHLHAAGLVLRVHDRFISRRRLLAEQTVGRGLADLGLTVAVALPWRGATVFPCGRRRAELEGYLPHAKPAPSPEAYAWLFGRWAQCSRARLVAVGGLNQRPRPGAGRHRYIEVLCRTFPDNQVWALGQANPVVNGLGCAGLLDRVWVDGSRWLHDARAEVLAVLEDGLVKTIRPTHTGARSFFPLLDLMRCNLRSLLAAYAGL